MTNRRKLFKWFAGSIVLLPLAGLDACKALPQALDDATTIANGVAAILPTVQQLVGIKDSVVAGVSLAISNIKQAASDLKSAAASGAMDLAAKIQNGVSTVQTLLAGFKLPSWVSGVISAAQTLAPIIPTLIGLIPAASADPRDIDQARAILIAAASRS